MYLSPLPQIPSASGILKPVLESIKKLVERDIWVEITNLLIPGYNTSSEAIKKLCDWVSALDEEIPLHFSRFRPGYHLKDADTTTREEIDQAVAIAKESGLKFIYAGNLAHENNNTFCPDCGAKVIGRRGFKTEINLEEGKCPRCGRELPIIL